MHRWTPFVQHFRQRHLGTTIALKLDSMLEELELTDPQVFKFCVNDNASNMQKAIRESNYLQQYLCDNHTLALVVKDCFDAVPGMKRLLTKTKELAKITHQSASVAHQQLQKQCKQINMQSVLYLKPVLQVLFTEDDHNLWSPHALSAAEWKLLQGACTILQPFKVQLIYFHGLYFITNTKYKSYKYKKHSR